MHSAVWTRRRWLKTLAGSLLLAPRLPALATPARLPRAFHLSLSPEVAAGDDELLAMARDAGVRAVWLAGFFYGHRPYSLDLMSIFLDVMQQSSIR